MSTLMRGKIAADMLHAGHAASSGSGMLACSEQCAAAVMTVLVLFVMHGGASPCGVLVALSKVLCAPVHQPVAASAPNKGLSCWPIESYCMWDSGT